MAYTAVGRFRDLEDGHVYETGEVFPHDGRPIHQARLKELAGSDNRSGRPLISGEADKPAETIAPVKTARRAGRKQ